jgi:hypothetical protein
MGHWMGDHRYPIRPAVQLLLHSMPTSYHIQKSKEKNQNTKMWLIFHTSVGTQTIIQRVITYTIPNFSGRVILEPKATPELTYPNGRVSHFTHLHECSFFGCVLLLMAKCEACYLLGPCLSKFFKKNCWLRICRSRKNLQFPLKIPLTS